MQSFQPTGYIPPPDAPGRYPLGILFMVIAAGSVLMAMCAIALQSESLRFRDGTEVLLSCLGGGVAGVFCGFFFGIYHYRRLRGGLLGALTGVVIFPMIVPIFLIEGDSAYPLLAVSLFGSLLLIGLATALRSNTARKL